MCKHTSVICRDTVLAAVTQSVETIQGLDFKCRDRPCNPEKAKPLDIITSKSNIVFHGLEEGRCPKDSGEGGRAVG